MGTSSRLAIRQVQLVGKPLPLTPAELDLAATVTAVDVAVARALWQQYASVRYVDLLEAMLSDDFVGAT